MTKEEAIEWIEKRSAPYHLQYECLEAFNSYVFAFEKMNPGQEADYAQEAACALYDWDI